VLGGFHHRFQRVERKMYRRLREKQVIYERKNHFGEYKQSAKECRPPRVGVLS
jgi:hypothetical protein